MMQLLLTIIEDVIMVIFIIKYLKIDQKNLFFYVVSILCIAETTIAEINYYLSLLLPVIMFATLLISVKLSNKKIVLNDLIACLLAPSMILITDLLSLVLLTNIFSVNIMIIAKEFKYILFASFVAKILLISFFAAILYLNENKNNILEHKQWWMLVPIWFVLFILLYFLGFSIINKKLTYNIIYYITFLLVVLSILFVCLLYKIQRENRIIRENELMKQKTYYNKKNMVMIRQLHNEITMLEHSRIYNLLYVKSHLIKKDYEELNSFVDDLIEKFKKFKNIINSENTFFDYMMNKMINKLMLYNSNIKVIYLIENKNFLIEKDNLENLIDIITKMFANSNKNSCFSIYIKQTCNFLVTSIVFIPNVYFSVEDLLIHQYEGIKYTVNKSGKFILFKVLIRVKE